MKLKGKIAVVTGAGSVGPGWGNGRATAVRFAQEGATVVALDRDDEALANTLSMAADVSGYIMPMRADLQDHEAISGLVEDILSQHERIDILVNNVGGSYAGGVDALSEREWQSQIDMNLSIGYRMMREIIPPMRAQRSGAIINLSSTSGIRWTGAAQAGYAAAKAGVIQLTKVTAVENGLYGIRANTIVPGQLHTPMVEARLSKQRSKGDTASLLEQRLKRIPLGFAGDGRDTAAAALFLASDDARFITGTEIIVDGGMSARCD